MMPLLNPLKVVPAHILRNLENPDFLKWLAIPDEGMLPRLVTYPEMIPVWAGINNNDCCENLADDFVYTVAFTRTRWQRMSKLPSRHLKANFEGIATVADQLAISLDAHAQALAQFVSPRLALENLLRRSISARQDISQDTIETICSRIGGLGRNIDDESFEGDALPSFQVLLRQFSKEIRSFEASEAWRLRPTKIAAASAERTYAVRTVASFFYEATREWRFDWVAATVNTMFDLSDDLLTEDHASKLIEKYYLV
jgi:hypothetical protein